MDKILVQLLARSLSSDNLTISQATAGKGMTYGLFPTGSFSVSALFLGPDCSHEH